MTVGAISVGTSAVGLRQLPGSSVYLRSDLSLSGIARSLLGTARWHMVPKAFAENTVVVPSALSTATPGAFSLTDWMNDVDLNWAASLSEKDNSRMRQEISNALVSSIVTGDWSAYHDTLYSWQATADVLSDPDLTADLLAEDDPAEEVVLWRP